MLSEIMKESIERRRKEMQQKGAKKEVIGNKEVFRIDGPEGKAVLEVVYKGDEMAYYSYKETSEIEK